MYVVYHCKNHKRFLVIYYNLLQKNILISYRLMMLRVQEANMYPKPVQDLSGWDVRSLACNTKVSNFLWYGHQ